MPTDPNTTWEPHLRVSWGGVLGDASFGEIFSNTVRYKTAAEGSGPPPNTLQTVADGVAPELAAWFARPASIISRVANLTYVKATWVMANGKQRDVNTAVHYFPNTGVAGNATTTPIWEQSYCLTLRSGLRRGRGHAGRIYPPLSGNQPTGVSPYCAAGDANSMATSFATCLTDMGNTIAGIVEPGGPTGGFAIMSSGNSVKGTTPMGQYIQTVVVDCVADIIHARTNRVKRLEGNPAPVPNHA